MLGRTDAPLTPTGRYQAQQAGQRLAQQPLPDLLLSSDLRRARQTAEHLAQNLPSQPPLEIWSDLTEVDLGCFSGFTWSEAQAHYPDLCHQLESSLNELLIPAAESSQATRQRAETCWQRLQQIPADRIWLVSHAGFLQHLVSVILGSPLSWGMPIAPLALFDLEVQPQPAVLPSTERYNPSRWRIHCFNQPIGAKIS